MAALAAAVEPLGVKNAVHLGRARRRRRMLRGGPACRKGDGVAAAAFEAGPVSGRKRGRLVEKEQLGIAAAPDRAMASLKSRHAADPLAGNPPPSAQRAIIPLHPPPPISP